MKIVLRIMMISMMFTVLARVSYAQVKRCSILLLAPDSRAGGIGESGGGLADNSQLYSGIRLV